MKYTVKIFLFAIVLYGCRSNQEKVIIEKPDLEMEVINDIIPQLVPEHPPCMVVPIENESPEDYDERLEAFYDEVDSVGKKIEIVSLLYQLDSNYIEAYKQLEKKSFVKHLLNAPNDDRRIDSTMIRNIENIKVLLVKDARSTIGGLTDCYTLGQFNISRVGFNKDSTRAAFTYFVDDGSCTDGKGRIIDAEFKNGKWQIRE